MNRRSFVGRLAALVGCAGLVRAAPETVHVRFTESETVWHWDTAKLDDGGFMVPLKFNQKMLDACFLPPTKSPVAGRS